MEITAGMVRRGYVETDGENDTHGFIKQDRRVWVEFREDFRWHKRSVWVDYLGDEYVLALDGNRFSRLAHGDSIVRWEDVDESHPNAAPKMEWEADW